MNGPILQLLKSLFFLSRWVVGLYLIFYLGLISVFGFGLLGLLFQNGKLEVFHSPFYFMIIPLMMSLTVSSRLESLQYYSLAFMAPHYRHHHLKVAMGIIIVLGWLPMFLCAFLISSDLASHCGVVVASTSVVLMFYNSVSTRVRAALLTVLFVAVISLTAFSIRYGWAPRWESPLWLSITLLLVGASLIVFFVKEFLAGREYGNTLSKSTWFGHVIDNWVKSNPFDLANRPYANFELSAINKRILQYRVGTYRKHKTIERMVKLVSCANGEDDALFFYFLFGVTCALALLALIYTNSFYDTDGFTIFIFGTIFSFICLFGLIERLFLPVWSVSNVWFRTPFVNKEAVLSMMTKLRIRVGLIFLLSTVLFITIAMGSAIPIKNYPLGISFLNVPGTAILLGSIGIVFYAISIGLLFERFGREWASTAMFVLSITALGLFVGLQNFIFPPHLQVSNFPACLMFFASSILLLGGVAPWWYKGYFDRRDNIIL